MEKDAYYFPHFCNARHDRKIKRVIKELGIEGYGIFFMLLETLRDQLDFRYPLEDIDLLSDEYGTSEQKVRCVICNYQLFTVDESNKFFSPKQIFYLQPYIAMKEQRRVAGIRSGEIRKERMLNIRSTTVQRMFNENEQRKVKESKGKESKVFTPPSFQEFSEYCISNGFTSIADRAFKGYEVANWHDAQGKQIHNWKQKLQNGWFRDENKTKPPQQEDPNMLGNYYERL